MITTPKETEKRMKVRRALATVGLGLTMVWGLIGCGNKNAVITDTTNVSSDADSATANIEASGTERLIRIGTWYPHYYDSTHQDIHDDPNMGDESIAQARLDAVREIEDTYHVRIEFVDLTWNGLQDSMNHSIVEGKPDCDIYEVDMSFGIPAALNGYAIDLETVLSPDADLLSTQLVFKPSDIGLEHGVYLFATCSEESAFYNTNMLAYNKDMIEAAELEDPYELWKRGEWTWDTWKTYMKKLTRDVDGDGVTDVYGFSSRWDYLVTGLLLSNGASIASGATESISSDKTREVFRLIYDLYNTERCARPWNSENFEDNVNAYTTGKVAMWISSASLSAENNDIQLLGDREGWVPFPVGPSGDRTTNNTKIASSGNAWMIPTGVENPVLVYQVFEDYTNWYHGDISLRDGDLSWWVNHALTHDNYEVMKYCGSRGGFDLWNALNIDYQVPALLEGEITVDQFVDQNAELVQNALDAMFLD